MARCTSAATTDEERQPIIDEITARVKGKVESAIRDGLTGIREGGEESDRSQ